MAEKDVAMEMGDGTIQEVSNGANKEADTASQGAQLPGPSNAEKRMEKRKKLKSAAKSMSTAIHQVLLNKYKNEATVEKMMESIGAIPVALLLQLTAEANQLTADAGEENEELGEMRSAVDVVLPRSDAERVDEEGTKAVERHENSLDE